MKIILQFFAAFMIQLLMVSTTSAQWNNRYTQLSDFGHHTYLEQHEISSGQQEWGATLISTTDIDVVELVVNGLVVEELPGIKAGETRHYMGSVDLPEGGWVAFRAYAGEPQEDAWPTMHARPFAHSSPVWIEAIGSTDATARSAAAADLIRAIDAAEQTMRTAYGETEMTRVMARFEEARNRLTGMLR
ncbi:MAG: hypothetical protein LC662_02270 [Rhodothermaceae bacterium]|nr:hypothetical protein [Rhodothermaceae bacterium]